MKAVGIILAVFGLVLLVYGYSRNNNWMEQLSMKAAINFAQGKNYSPGTPFMIGGGIGLAVGAVLAAVGFKKS